MSLRGRLAAVCSFAIAMLAFPPAGAELVAALSNHLVAISTGFSGTDVLLFGAIDGTGDVVVVVRGPESVATCIARVGISASRSTRPTCPSPTSQDIGRFPPSAAADPGS